MALFYDSDSLASDYSGTGNSYLAPIQTSYEYVQDFVISREERMAAPPGCMTRGVKGHIETSFNVPLLGSFDVKLTQYIDASFCFRVSTECDFRYSYKLKLDLMGSDVKGTDCKGPCASPDYIDGRLVWSRRFTSSNQDDLYPLKIRIHLILVPKNQNSGFFPAVKHLARISKEVTDIMFSGAPDVTFHVGGQQVMAHQLILTKKSPVFATMFSSQLREAKSKEVVIEDSSFKVFVEFIRYLYAEAIEEKTFDRHWAGLLDLAEKYDVAGLKRACSDYSTRKLTTETCLEYYAAAVKYSLDDAKGRIATFIQANAEQVTGSLKWKSFVEEMTAIGTDLSLRDAAVLNE